jgi:hypothetical protein
MIFEIANWILLYLEASKIYESLRLMSFSIHYEHQSKVMDLLITIFIIAHFIVRLFLLRLSCCTLQQRSTLNRIGLSL